MEQIIIIAVVLFLVFWILWKVLKILWPLILFLIIFSVIVVLKLAMEDIINENQEIGLMLLIGGSAFTAFKYVRKRKK